MLGGGHPYDRPHLLTHVDNDIVAREMTGGFGSMLSVRVRAGAETAIRTAANVKLWKRATSLGEVESLIEYRSSTAG